ncbi:polysaccharide deacetylase family protein [Foetidibacter luteolus]|uniref:polysaccharide deacetylase family protein n=1 Tax=Foetidibacter luteolus TaxID=2608880 RepID=UPI001F274640|nr:polysaccharide deacetylase family protein [Foetidibacter luteolus]
MWLLQPHAYIYSMFYFIKTNWWLKKLYPSFVWEMPAKDKVLYLTFDDGPHEQATGFVLDELQKYNAKATFFCIGKNVVAHPAIYRRILDEGHRAGNHSHNHLNGWKTGDAAYINDVHEAARHIDSDLFRPPYGRISKFQARLLQAEKPLAVAARNFRIIMWSVLSGDFDTAISPEKCWNNVLLNTSPGAIILFHDSTKAWDRMSYALPKLLEYYSNEGYSFAAIE